MSQKKRPPLAELPPQANLSPEQVARFLDVSVRVVYEMIAEGLPAGRMGRAFRIPREDFRVWYANRTQAKKNLPV